jgi:hypothetical protein
MIELRLIDVLPLLGGLPNAAHEALADVLGVSAEAVFCADSKTVAGHETEVAQVVSDACLAAVGGEGESHPLEEPLATLIPLAAHLCSGQKGRLASLPTLTLREIHAEDLGSALTAVVEDVVTILAGPAAGLRHLSQSQRACAAATAAAIATIARSPVQGMASDVALLAAWGRWEAGLRTFDELMAAVRAGGCPTDALSAWEALRQTDLESLGLPYRSLYDPAPGLEHVRRALSERERTILETRTWSLDRGRTLAELADDLGLTRERVRQLENQALRVFTRETERPENAALFRAASRFRDAVGAASPVPVVERLWPDAVGDTTSDRFAALLFLYLAGPYEQWSDWLVRRPPKDVVAASVSQLEALFRDGFPLLEEALSSLEGVGVSSVAAREWLMLLPHVRILEDYVVPWGGTLADKAEVVLRAYGRPLGLEEIVEGISETFNVRTLRNYLLADKRFRRLGLRVFGLEEWGGEEYTKISDEIAQEIERRGGEVALEHLVETLTRQFGVTANSVKAYANGPQFERAPSGMIRTRTSRAQAPSSSVEFTKRCFRVDADWSYRLTVTYDTIRGSGTSIPQGFAAYLGLAHGDELELVAAEQPVRFTWPSLLPSVGSLRPAVEALDAVEGDYLFLTANAGTRTATIIKVEQTELDAAVGPERLRL